MKNTGNSQPGGAGCGASSSATTYDANGNAASRTDFNGNRTNYTYDLARNLETSRTEGLTATGANTPAVRTITTAWHPTYSLPVKTTEPGQEITWIYDKHGNITNKTVKDTATAKTRSWSISYSYSATVPGALLQKVENGPRTDVSDITTTGYYAPDATCIGGHLGCRGQISQITNALGHLTRITRYSAHGQPEEIIGSNGLVTTLAYDTRQRLLSVDISGETAQFQYDNAGLLTRITHSDNSALNYSYDAAHRLTQIGDNLGNKIVYTLDAMGNRLNEDIFDPTGQLAQTHRSEYDALSRLAKDIGADNQTSRYAYDNQGNLTDTTDPLNHTTSHDYDSLNRLIQNINPANGIGHLTGMTDESGSTSYAYDLQGRLLSKSQTTKLSTVSFTHSLSYTYNSAGHLSTQTYPSGLQIDYGYDTQGRVNSINLNGLPLLNNLTYQPFGQAKSWTWGNGQSYTRNFVADGRLADYTLGSDSRLITYDAASRIIVYNHSTVANNRNFDYDLADRLSVYNDNISSQTYQYDANGNRTSLNLGGTTYLFNTALTSNRLLTTHAPIAKTYSYDAAGNSISDGATVFTWNAGGRLSKAVTGARSNTYKHNGLGERVIKSGSTLTNGPYRFIYDQAGHLIGEYDKNNALRQETVWLGDMPVAVVKKDAITRQFLIYYIQTDHLNTPRVILNNANIPVWRWDNSDAFGAGLPNEDPDKDGKNFEYNLRFPGQYYDKETGLHYNYFRDYDPGTGRYLQSDPIGLQGGLNTYGYVVGNPVNAIDPDGRNPLLLLRLFAAFMPMIDLQMMAVDDVPGGGAGRACGVAKGAEKGGLNLFKWGKDTTTKVDGWKEGDFMLHLPNKGSPKANWAQNSGRLREEIGRDKPIYDSYRNPVSRERIPTDGFLRAERNLLESRGWQYNPSTDAYHPPVN